MRQLLILFLLFLVGSWFSRKVREAQSRHAPGAPRRGDAAADAGPGATRNGALIEPMVRCEACGIHVPKGDAIAAAGRYYCCAEHAARTGEREGV